MFTTIIVQPIFNLLVLICAVLPGHNFGLAIIIFTIIIRILMWPLVKKQMHQAKAMRELQPELKKIKADAKGDRQKESRLVMELYKEREINPFGTIGILIVQLPIFIGLYSVITRIVEDPHTLVTFSYSWLHNLPWIESLSGDITRFDSTLLGIVNLTESAIQKSGGIYIPAFIIVLGSAVSQYFQSKQLLPDSKDSRSLRKILKDAGSGKKADQGEVNAAVGRSTRYLLPGLILFVTIGLPAALPLYWLTTGVVAYFQQAKILNQDETELMTVVDKTSSTKTVIEGEVVPPINRTSSKGKKSSGKKKRKR